MKLNKWTKKYLELYKKPFIKKSTYERYITCLAHVPDLKVDKLTTEKLQKFINGLMAQNLSSSSVKQVKILINQALKRAKSLGYEVGADFSGVQMPKKEAQRVRALLEDEQIILIRNLHRSYYGDFFGALLCTGLRVGELIALDWNDVNLRSRTFSVNATAFKRDTTTPKTASSLRILPINDDFYAILKRHFALSGRVFTNFFGGVVSYRSVLDAWHRLLDVCGLESMGLHVLRHTYATNALRAGVDIKVLSRLLGHASVATTLNYYCDVTEADKKTASERIALYLSSLRSATGRGAF